MPTCGFIRVQPDGMKIKDEGNRQRYDPVSKRMITIYPETPPVLELTLLSISQPTFVDSLFLSDYTVSFRRYSGCLSYGNDVRISIYNSGGTQVATTVATLASGVNTLVLRGEYTPGGYSYYASLRYGPIIINSNSKIIPPETLPPELFILSNTLATISPLNFYQEVGSVGWSYDNSFFWSGTLYITFRSYEASPTPATYTIRNITDPVNPVELSIANPSFNVSAGQNTITIPDIAFINISSATGRISLPHRSTETFSITLTNRGITFSLPNITVSPKLIQDVVLVFINTAWYQSRLYGDFSVSYRLADGSLSALRGGVISDSQRITLTAFGATGATPLTGAGSYLRGGGDLPNRIGQYTFTDRCNFPSNPEQFVYRASVEYSRPSFADLDLETVDSSAINFLTPEITYTPEITSIANIRLRPSEPLGLIGDVTVAFEYNPRDIPLLSMRVVVLGTVTSYTALDSVKTVATGENVIQLQDIAVIPGELFVFGVIHGDRLFSASEFYQCPSYSNLYFTSVPTTARVSIALPSFISITWSNTIAGYTGGQVTLATIGLGTDSSIVVSSPSRVGTTDTYTLTFTVNPSDTTAGNAIEQNLSNSVAIAGSFPPFRFILTDSTTRASVLSSEIIGSFFF